jgi:hypothetical protein
MMQKVIILIFIICNFSIAIAQKSTDNFSGKWKTEKGIVIEITKVKSSFIGKPLDKNVLVLNDLTFTNGKWRGILINPKKDVSVNCEAYLQGNKIKFIVTKGLITKELIWIKVN